jgi:diketogulonate reductase-like aldo/keto reductase
MEELKRSGLIKSIGVSNYLRADLEATLKTAQDSPVMNQIEYHPYLQRAYDYVPWMKSQGIQVAAFKPLTPVVWCPEGPLKGPLDRMAKAHGTTSTAILLSWYFHKGIVAVTTTRKALRLREYSEALKVKLTDQEADEISRVGLTKHFRNAWGEKFADDDRS